MSRHSTPRLIHEFLPLIHDYPITGQDAITRLLDGNDKIRTFHDECRNLAGGKSTGAHDHVIPLSPRQVGLNHVDDLGFPKQAPWAVFLGCADARVPSEMLFGQGFNDLFDIRVAGNVLSDESSASLIFALRHYTERPKEDLPWVRLVVVLGHRGCGAVKAVVDHFQQQRPPVSVAQAMDRLGTSPLENLMRRIYLPAFAEVAARYDNPADASLRRDLIEETVLANARMTAEAVSRVVKAELGKPEHAGVTVAYGVYDPLTFEVSDRAFTEVERATPSRERKSRLGLVP